MAEETQIEQIRKRTVVYRVPEMDAVTVRRDVEVRPAGAGVEPLTLDLYYPPHQESRTGLPALVFVMGYPDPGMRAMMGCSAKEVGQYTSWARLAAAHGMVGVTYSAPEPAADTLAVLSYCARTRGPSGSIPSHRALVVLGQRPQRARRADARSARLDALRGPLLRDHARRRRDDLCRRRAEDVRFVNSSAGRSAADLPSETPLFVARAGNDEIPHLNDTIDRFVADALALDLPITVINHRGAPHAFDTILDDEPTREVIRQMLAFLCFHLAA